MADFRPNRSQRRALRQTLLWQIAETHRRGLLPHLYLGYWISDCRKLRYKQKYRHLELFLDGCWQRFEHDQTLPHS